MSGPTPSSGGINVCSIKEQREVVARVYVLRGSVNHPECSLWVETTVVCCEPEHTRLNTHQRTWQQQQKPISEVISQQIIATVKM